MREQSRTMSLVETVTNTLVGLVLATVCNYFLFQWLGIKAGLSQGFEVAAILTIVSVARGFVLRRVFEKVRVKSLST